MSLLQQHYRCDFRQDLQDRRIYSARIELQRMGPEGLEPINVYLTLGATFPTHPPRLAVSRMAMGSSPHAELDEEPLPVKVAALAGWHSERQLSEVVDEVAKQVGHDPGLLAALDLNADTVVPINGPGSLSLPVPDNAPRRSKRLWLAALLGALVLIGGTGGFFWYQGRDPCAEAAQAARDARAAGGEEGLGRAINTYEQMLTGAERGEGGSCAELRQDASPLREAYLEYGQILFGNGKLEEAARAYQRAGELGAATSARAQIQIVLNRLWSQVDTARRENSSDSWAKAAGDLETIQRIDPAALEPGATISVAVPLFDAYLTWGDRLYKEDRLSEAGKPYEQAEKLLAGDFPAAERDRRAQALAEHRAWLDRREQLNALTVESGGKLVAELKSLAGQTPGLRDPAGITVEQRLAEAHVRYGRALLAQGDNAALAALEQARAALALLPKDPAALSLFDDARQPLLQNSAYQLTLETDRPDWGNLLNSRSLSDTLAGRPVNLLVLTDEENLQLLLVNEQGEPLTSPEYKDRTVAVAALPAGTYRLAVDGKEADYNYVTLTVPADRATTHLVRILKRSAP